MLNFAGVGCVFLWKVHSLKLTAKAPENRPKLAPKRKPACPSSIHFKRRTRCQFQGGFQGKGMNQLLDIWRIIQVTGQPTPLEIWPR